MAELIPLGNRLDELNLGYEATNVKWRQVVYDHRLHLLENATVVSIGRDATTAYNYRPTEYLTDVHNYPLSACWIILWLNNMETDEWFNVTSLLVPEFYIIGNLYEAYLSYEELT